ncbi:MAG: glycoside hydrolase family 2 protein, partial [Solirubrobacterales bacterium]|nr:glycoside hydrolase family 2 protein [Solirubrobacterales bacterium]
PAPTPAPPGRHARVDEHEERRLAQGWEVAATRPGAHDGPAGIEGLDWREAGVPTTAAAVVGAGGTARDLDAEDWWFRTTFAAEAADEDEAVLLCLDGVATVADVFLNGELLARTTSMWTAYELDVGARLRGHNELVICCRALAPLLQVARRPRARWRTRLVADGNLRWLRTMLLGRMPGIAPWPAAVGPWRPVRLVRQRRWTVEGLRLRPVVIGDHARLRLAMQLRAIGDEPPLHAVHVTVDGPTGCHEALLPVHRTRGGHRASGFVEVPDAATWWPHTHGEPSLYDVRLRLLGPGEPLTVAAGRVGFRTLTAGPAAAHDVEAEGLDLHLNGVRVFVRGAVWTPVDPVSLVPGTDALRATVTAARDAGLNMLRVVGTGAYEEPAFHDLCDELGMLVWQDLMFANLDYPIADPGFTDEVCTEIRQVLDALGGRPSFAVLCGNSEVEQQVAMLGLDSGLGRGPLFGELVPGLLHGSLADAIHVPSAPCGGVLPFRPERGVVNWFAVGGYRRPLDETRRAGVRFASECLAFSNVPGEDIVDAVGPDAGVPADAGADWDFADVRDHYLHELYGVDPERLRATDPSRYLELSRAVSGEVMAQVFGEWRRAASPCGGGIVLWLRDLVPGAGWGLLDSDGRPKVVYHHLRRALSPVAVWLTDEGLGGLRIHVANDRPVPLAARLAVALYRDGRHLVAEGGSQALTLAPHTVTEHDAEAVLGSFTDINYTHRFGPIGHDLVVVSLLHDTGGRVLSQATFLPQGRSAATVPVAASGLRAHATTLSDGAVHVHIFSDRVAHGVRVHADGFQGDDDAFTIAPGGERDIVLRATAPSATFTGATVTTLDTDGPLTIAPGPAS